MAVGLEHHPSLGLGIVRDQPRHMLKDGLYDCVDGLVDVAGKVRRRGGTRRVLTTAQQYGFDWIAAYASSDIDQIRRLYAFTSSSVRGNAMVGVVGSGGVLEAYNAGALAVFSRPFQHSNLMVAFSIATDPTAAVSTGGMVVVAGSPFPLNGAFFDVFVNPSGASVTQGKTELVVDPIDGAFCPPGRIVSLTDSTSRNFTARIVARSADLTRVYMDRAAPWTGTFAAGAGSARDVAAGASGFMRGARCGCSFQNRIVAGHVAYSEASGSNAVGSDRIAWTTVPGETVPGGSLTLYGMTEADPTAFLKDNFLRVPDVADIVSVIPAGDAELLVVGAERTARIVGSLATINDSNQSLPVDVLPLSEDVGCLSDRSVQATPYGPVWADREGVWSWSGGRLRNLMAGSIQSLWGDLQRRAGFAIRGSAFVGDSHYLLSTSAANLVLNLRSGGWVRLRDDLVIASSAKSQADPSRVYACGYTSPTLSALPAATADGVFRLDSMLAPDATNSLDHDGQAVQLEVTSRAYPMGTGARLKRIRRATAAIDVKGVAGFANGNLLALNAGAEEELYLPNAGGEDGLPSPWWAVASTVTADTAQKRTGKYALKFVTTAPGGGIRYTMPGGYGDGNTIFCAEVWVRSQTAGTVNLTLGGVTQGTTATNAWTQLVVAWRPVAGVFGAADVAVGHTVTAATVHVDDLHVSVLQPVQDRGTLLTSGSTVVRDTQNAHTGNAGFKVTCTATGHGINHNPRLTLKQNVSHVASVWAKTISGSTDYELVVGDGTTNAVQAVTLTSSWKRFSVTVTPSADVAAPVVALRRASNSAGTFACDDFALAGPDPEVLVAVVGGLEAEGDDGDGTANDASFANFADDYSTNGPWAASGGDLAPTISAGSAVIRHRRGGSASRDGEVVIGFTHGHASDRVGAIVDTYTDSDYLMFESRGGGLSSARKSVAGVITSLVTGTAATITLGVPYWVRAVRRGRRLIVEHHDVDPALGAAGTVLAEHYLSDADAALFETAGQFGMRLVAGDATLRVNDFRCSPYSNLGVADADPSAPVGVSGTMHIVTRAATLVYRQAGAAAEVELAGVDLEYDLLRPGRVR